MKDLSLHILDIVQNSVYAGASEVEISIQENQDSDEMLLLIKDNGQGMSEEILTRVTDPYYTTRTTRKVGLGIPLLKQNAEQAGGSFKIKSAPGRGTEINAVFGFSHLDRPPKGDLAGVISMLAGMNPEMDFIYRHVTGNEEYVFDTKEIKEVLEDVSLREPSVISYLKEMIEENLKELE